MKRLKCGKILGAVFFILSCFWIVLLVVSTLFRLAYRDNITEPLAVALDKAVYGAFIIISIMGVVSSILGYLSFAKTSGPAVSNKKIILKKFLYSFAIAENIVFYLSFCAIFAMRRDIITISLMLAWSSLSLLTIILFAVVKLQIRASNKKGRGAIE